MASQSSTIRYETLDSDDGEAPTRDKAEIDVVDDKEPNDVEADKEPSVDVDPALPLVAVTDEDETKKTCCWLEKTDLLVYSSQALSAWGDRMWSFAVALFLVELEDNSLRLTAVFGFSMAISVLMFGALVGKWVDNTSRLKATQVSLLCQNSFVIVCATILLFLLKYKDWFLQVWYPSLYLLCLLVILLGVIANLFSMAQKICIQKDWVVVLAGDDREKLAKINAGIRRIDLSVNILAPIIVGFIMNFGSMTIAALFIAGWNIVSMFVEYTLLLKVYEAVPALATKGVAGDKQASDVVEEASVQTQDTQAQDGATTSQNEQNEQDSTIIQSKPCCSLHHKIGGWFTSTYQAWVLYKSYTVSWAGMGLALVYMTVMGFDSITNGYGYSLGIPEYMLGIFRALGSVTGIIGTIIYPVMHKKIGLERTGLYAMAIDILCLMPCLLSIWAPGSPFDPIYYQRTSQLLPQNTTSLTFYEVPSTQQSDITSGITTLPGAVALEYINSTLEYINSTETPTQANLTRDITTATIYTSSFITTRLYGTTTATTMDKLTLGGKKCMHYIEVKKSFWSAALFFAGIILSRIGLWTFDLAVTQSIQENIKENERGVFNGVQRSLECSMDMLHFILVIALPCSATFGYLIILSVAFVICGAMSFAVYSYKIRGHLIHPEKLC